MKTFRFNDHDWQVTELSSDRLVATRRPGGADLRAVREKLGLTTRAMAERLGISQSKLVKLESGSQWKSLPAVLAQAKKL